MLPRPSRHRRRPPTALLVVPVLALGAWAVAAATLAVAGRTAAQPPYPGVVPGSGQAPPRPERAVRGDGDRVTVTWPGFQMLPDGRSRFFVQTTGPVTYESFPESGRFVLLLRNARIHLRNNRRPLVTRYFDTPVQQAKLARRGRDLAFELRLRPGADARPSIREQGGAGGSAFRFLYLEFPEGDWLPPEDRPPPPAVRPAEVSPEERQELDAMDEEAPPDFGEVGPAGQ